MYCALYLPLLSLLPEPKLTVEFSFLLDVYSSKYYTSNPSSFSYFIVCICTLVYSCIPTQQMHCTENSENSKQIFPEMKLRASIPNFYIHVSASDLYIPTISPQIVTQQIVGPILEIYKLLTDT
jgi:hypothetical protein